MGKKKKQETIKFPVLTVEEIRVVHDVLDVAWRIHNRECERLLPFVKKGEAKLIGQYRYHCHACAVISWIGATSASVRGRRRKGIDRKTGEPIKRGKRKRGDM